MQYYEPETSGISQPSVLARKKVRNQLRGNWQQEEDFFHRFFPMNARSRKILSIAKAQLYVETGENPRWVGIPRVAKSVGPRLYTGLNNLLNEIINYFMPIQDNNNPRLFIKTYRRKVLPNDGKPFWPGILLAGAGTYFVRATTTRPTADYRSAISPLEVIPESADAEVARERLATIVQDIFFEQPNRRFVFGLVMSPRTLTCCLFDHSGVVFSSPLDYHEHPDQFCALIAGMASTDAAHIGFDTSMFIDETGLGRIQTRNPIKNAATPTAPYMVNSNLYHAPHIIGRGTTCFLAHQAGDPETRYVIKDTWISEDEPELEGRESEASLLLHAKSKGVVRGIAQICHSEEVRLKNNRGKLLGDNIYNIRRLNPSEYSRARQRVHVRIVLSTYGKPLEEFSTRREFLLAYYDAVRAHRDLYETAGILHRDIKPGNILINPNGKEGERGVLIDLDRAIRTDNTSPYSLRKQIGTHLFMSINALEGEEPQGYLDDLESFYYVLIYIITMFTGPNSPKGEVPYFVGAWQRPRAAGLKRGQLIEDTAGFGIEPWFGDSFRHLVDRLQEFFASRLIKSRRVESITPAEPSDEFISHINQAILELGDDEDVSQPSTEQSLIHTNPHIDVRPNGRPRTEERPTMAASRSLRPNVHYGRHRKH